MKTEIEESEFRNKLNFIDIDKNGTMIMKRAIFVEREFGGYFKDSIFQNINISKGKDTQYDKNYINF